MKTWLQENLFTLAESRGMLRPGKVGLEINQTAVEQLTKVPQTTQSGIMKQGKIPRIDTLIKLATGFEVELWQLLAPPAVFRASLTPKFAELVDVLSRQ